MAGRVTLREVARKSGVSVAAASRALNDRPGVQPQVQQRVKLVAEALGYQPNRSAQSLVSGRSSMLGLVVGGLGLGTNPYAANLVNGITRAAAARDHGLALVADVGDPADTVRRVVSHRQIDGIILSVTADRSPLAANLLATDLPIVLIGADPAYPEAYSVQVENLESSARLVEHLLDGGARRVATITGRPHRADTRERLEGYRRAHERRGLTAGPELIFEGDFSAERSYQLADEIFSLAPDAVFCANDDSALGLHRRARETGRDDPERLSIAGFDGTHCSPFDTPRITSMVQPFDEIARVAVDLMLSLLDGEEPPERCLTIEPQLVIGDTTRP